MTMKRANFHPDNERIKRRYLIFLKEARQQNEATIDAVAAALHRFETFTRFRSFNAFHIEQARAFKADLNATTSPATGRPLSKATIYAMLMNLKRFFQWLAEQPGYRKAVTYGDAEYFNPSEKDVRVATARRSRPHPTVEQVLHVLEVMPADCVVERRDRALVAFTLLTGARDGAIASLKLRHVDLDNRCVFQDARQVNTKFSKSFTTYFIPVSDAALRAFEGWVIELREQLLWGADDPLFPATEVGMTEQGQFAKRGLLREHWKTATPIRQVFKRVFERAGLPYYNPHSFRNMLVGFGEKACRTPEEFKAFSQNLGHDNVLTTFTSYGAVATKRQGELVTRLAASSSEARPTIERLLEELSAKVDRLKG